MRRLIHRLAAWYVRTYVAWAKRHKPWSFLIDFGAITLAAGFAFWCFGSEFGFWVGLVAGVVPFAFPLVAFVYAKKGRAE
jgi:uncharacterized membrane protein